MSPVQRIILCSAILSTGLGAQATMERLSRSERPSLRSALATIPKVLGDWVGVDQSVPDAIVQQSQTTDYLSRVYESLKHPGLKLQLWLNFSEFGNNLRHTPEICLPSTGWDKIESQTHELDIPLDGSSAIRISRLGYGRGELVEHVGFWYYIFGEGKLENYVRRLPITSRSSHGRTTRGSSMTVEVFYAGDLDPDDVALREFARELTRALDPILPLERAEYYNP